MYIYVYHIYHTTGVSGSLQRLLRQSPGGRWRHGPEESVLLLADTGLEDVPIS